MASIFDWSSTAASNTTIDGINSNTGMSPANVDNLFRSVVAIIRQTFTSALQSFFAGTAPLPIANGGTGGTDATTALNNLNGLNSAYRNIPLTDKLSSFTLADADRSGCYKYLGTAGTMTINPDATTPTTPGAVYMVWNGGTGALTITRGSGVTIYKNGANVSADAVIAIGGQATIYRIGTDFWTVNGVGVS